MTRVSLVVSLAYLVSIATTVSAQHHTVRFFTSYGTPKQIEELAFSPSGEHLAVAVKDGPLAIVETRTGDVLHEFKTSPFTISFSADGRHVLGIGEHETVLANALTGSLSKVGWNIPEGYVGCDFKEKAGKLLVESVTPGGPAADSGRIRVGDELVAIISSGREYPLLGRPSASIDAPIAGPPGTPVTLRLIPKGKTRPVDIEIFRKSAVKEGQQLRFREARGGRSPQVCCCQSGGTLVLVDANTGSLVSLFRPIDLYLGGVGDASTDGRQFAWAANRLSATGKRSNELGLEVFDVSSQQRTHFTSIDASGISSIRFTSDNRRVFIGGRDRILVYNLAEKKFDEPVLIGFDPKDAEAKQGNRFSIAQATFGIGEDSTRIESPESLLTSFDVSADGSMVAVGSPHGQCSLFATSEHKCLTIIGERSKDYDGAVETTFSPNGRWVAYFVKGTLNIVSLPELIQATQTGEADVATRE